MERNSSSHPRKVSPKAIADSLRQMMVAASDLSKGDMVRRLMSLYPDSGRVVSASAGRVTASRDTLEGITLKRANGH